MYEYKNLLVNTAEDGITTVTINRPKALNALDTLTLEEMKDCFNRLASDVATNPSSLPLPAPNPLLLVLTLAP